MTDKERFEELAYNVGISLDGEKALMSSDDYDFLYNYALEQAERVELLEIENKLLNDILTTLEKQDIIKLLYQNVRLIKQNKRYREAIEKAIEEVYEEYETLWIVGNLQKALEGESNE